MLTINGAAALTDTAHDLADHLRAGLDGLEAAEEVLGYINPPVRTGRLKSTVHAEATPAGFALVAGGPEAPYAAIVHARQPFLTDPLDARSQAVADQYAAQIDHLLENLRGA